MTMRRFIGCLLAALAPATAGAQPATEPAGALLSLDEAVRIAVAHNRQVLTASLEVEKSGEDLAIARIRRRPTFDTELSASMLLTPVKFGFPRGAFGDFPGVGPIPATDTTVDVPQQPTAYVSASVSQPISQLFRINLGVRSAETTVEIERTRVRATRLSVVNNVRRLYFAMLQTQSALAANEEAIALYRELDRTLRVRLVQKVALRSDAMDVEMRLAQEEHTRTVRLNTLASQKEQLNQLLGRDVRTRFEVERVSAISPAEVDLAAAQRNALDTRPDVHEARLNLQQAELGRRIAKAERIPDVSAAISYTSNFNIDVLPTNLATAGLRVTWEPFDWGRRSRELAAKTRTVEQAKLAVRDAEDRAVVEVGSRFRTLAEARAMLRVTELAQSSAREKLRVTTNQYQIQAALLPDVLKQRAELADTADQHQQALLAFWTAKADLDLATGEEGLR
jgi:outer membrane protein TolC